MTGLVASFAQWVYAGLVRSYAQPPLPGARTRRRVFGRLRTLVLGHADPVVSLMVDGQDILLHLSHSYPLLKAAHRFYDTGLRRLCTFVKATDGCLDVIDVGANVGDSLLQVPSELGGRFLCIEADDRYFPLLERNARTRDGVTCLQVVCDETNGEATHSLVHTAGTSRVAADGGDRRFVHKTLDRIVAELPHVRANVLKIDTDGYDYKVLRGARTLLERDKPVLFFELAPEHLEAAGEEPISVFPFLSAAGYRQVFIYDNLGRPLVRIDTTALEPLNDLLAYARLAGGFYFDVVAFHASRSADLDRFVAAERRFFADATP